MKNKSIKVVLLLLIFFQLVKGQGYWTQKANFPAGPRMEATSFAINGKGYVSCGIGTFSDYNDLWEYDPASDSWTQKADLPGVPRSSPISFVINNKAYVGTGYPALSDLWEYDPQSDSWTQKSSLPGAGRRKAMSFTVLNKGFVYGGYNTSALNDLWEYDPITDLWTQKNNGPGQARCWGVSFVLNDTAYVGGGESNNLQEIYDMWKYDAGNDQWSQVTQYPNHRSLGPAAFAIGNYAYTGISYNTGWSYNTDDSLWQYIPQGNYWFRLSHFPSASRYSSISFSMGGKGYVGLGKYYLNSGSDSTFYDFWEYSPDSSTGVDDFNLQKSSVNIFPNPFNEKLGFATGSSEQWEVILYDNTSRKILQQDFSKSIFLNTTRLENGIYLYEVRNQNGLIKAGKVVKE
jgi:N-acetylneuraminic acid mutarotase